MRRPSAPQPAPRPIPERAPAFFVPHASDAEQAESVWQGTVAFLRDQGFDIDTDRRIYCLAYTHDGRRCVDVVGEPDRYGMEEVLIILRSRGSGPTLVCTANRGVLRGDPIFAPSNAFGLPFSGQ